MAREATGEVRQSSAGTFSTLVRTWAKRETFQLPTCRDETEAEKRSTLLAIVARRFRLANVNRGQGDEALKGLAGASPRAVEGAVGLCEQLLGGKLPREGGAKVLTFAEIGKKWTDGDLHRDHPDHVKAKDTRLDLSRLGILSPIRVDGRTIGDIPIDEFRLDHAEAAMRGLPKSTKRAATRRGYAQVIHRVLALAVYPLRLIPTNPLPKGFMPKVGKPPAFSYLYPPEDAALMACGEVPLAYRLLYGFLAREGCRLSEALDLRWRDLDLERGVITLDKNKTDDARAWALDPGVARALRAWQKRGAHTFVFAHEGGVIGKDQLAEKLRESLISAGVTRPELHKKGENRGQFRVHDLRGTFVTLSLAAGRSETWVADRTGHTSSQMINRYRRAARSANELSLGQLAPLDMAIPELSMPQECHSEPTRGDDGGQDDRESSINPAVSDTSEIDASLFNPKVAGSIPARPTESSGSEIETATSGRSVAVGRGRWLDELRVVAQLL